MDELLTAKQVQNLLKVDRTTIYRMLDDGRLTGIKVGQQWRFPRSTIQSILEGKPPAARQAHGSACASPIRTWQPIQDIFAEVMGIGAVTTAPDGVPLTQISNCCRFCQLILASESGRAACLASWRNLARRSDKQPRFVPCHAGLHYVRAQIQADGAQTAVLVAGQFYAEEPDDHEQAARIKRLAETHNIDEAELRAAACSLSRLDDHKRCEIGRWLDRVAQTFEEIGSERADLRARLEHISAMCSLEPSPGE